MTIKTSLLVLISLLLISSVYTEEGHKCTHDHQDHPEPEIADIAEDFPAPAGRLLQDLPNFRMKVYYGALADEAPEFQSYVANDLMPPIVDYFQAALKIPYPLTNPIKFGSQTICNIPISDELRVGVPVDFYYILAGTSRDGDSYVADTYACYLAKGTVRPYIARTLINTAKFFVANGDVLMHEKNTICMMHELTHALGFAASLYKYFLNANGTAMTGHVFVQELNGVNTTVINVEPLTTRLRSFFGCSNLKGAYLENDGATGTVGSHFERRHFGFEAMTSGLIDQMQYSQFTLALLEGSGWYKPDYKYADPFYFGQGQGCTFLFGACDPASFDEFCTGSSRGCTSSGLGGGVCGTDNKSAYCRSIRPKAYYSCEDPDVGGNFRLAELQSFGRDSGSKCFTGTLSSALKPTGTTFCFKPTCAKSTPLAAVYNILYIQVGSTKVTCTKKGDVTVAGYTGVINCPDPIEFCSTIGAPVCPRGCMGRGDCIQGKCACQPGYTGKDCSLNIPL